MTLPGAVERRPARLGDRVFKWAAAIAGLCLLGFIGFVVLRGPSHVSGGGTDALKVPPPRLLAVGTAAPPFAVPALGGGQPVSLSNFRGKPVILNFFASWCRDCRQELGAVAAVGRRNKGRVAVLGVDTNETSQATAQRLLLEAHATYPVGVDAAAKVAQSYLLVALPVSYFIDANGTIVGAVSGPQTVSSLQRWVARLEGHP
jgi:cytochrome c biogenesis protein CcmG, thiol:disulfide interchange protein DsbE